MSIQVKFPGHLFNARLNTNNYIHIDKIFQFDFYDSNWLQAELKSASCRGG